MDQGSWTSIDQKYENQLYGNFKFSLVGGRIMNLSVEADETWMVARVITSSLFAVHDQKTLILRVQDVGLEFEQIQILREELAALQDEFEADCSSGGWIHFGRLLTGQVQTLKGLHKPELDPYGGMKLVPDGYTPCLENQTFGYRQNRLIVVSNFTQSDDGIGPGIGKASTW